MNRFSYSIYVLYHTFRNELIEALKPLGVSLNQYLFMACIYNKTGITQDQLCYDLVSYKSNITLVAKQLVEAGYVLRDVNMIDRRGFNLYLTEKGEELCKQVQVAVETITARYYGAVDRSDLETFLRVLKKFEDMALPPLKE